MKKIENIRTILSEIPGAIHDIDTEAPIIKNDAKVLSGENIPYIYCEDEPPDESDFEARDTKDFREFKKLLDRNKTEVEQKGTEALAWYVSFHSSADWGIYIPVSSLHKIALSYFNNSDAKYDEKLNAAFRALVDHEMFHFIVDYQVAQLEMLQRKAYRKLTSDRISPNYLEIEEALANGYMLAQAKRSDTRWIVEGLESMCANSPAGYSDGPKYAAKRKIEIVLPALMGEYFKSWINAEGLYSVDCSLGIDLFDSHKIWPKIDGSQCNVHLFDDLPERMDGDYSVAFYTFLSSLKQSKKFNKQLRNCHRDIQDDWKKKSQIFQTSIPPSADFKIWKNKPKPSEWSLRLREGYRVHVIQEDRKNGVWVADSIGGHQEMGHGK